MSIEKMSVVTIQGDVAYLDETLLQCISSGCFHPVSASSLSEYESNVITMRDENVYANILNKLNDISTYSDIDLKFTGFDQLDMTTRDFTTFVAKLERELNQFRIKKQGVETLIRSHKQALAHLEHLKKLGENFDDIFHCEYLEIRFGKMPVESYDKLHYYMDKPFVIFSYDNDSMYHWCLYICATPDKKEIDGLFRSLFFERIHIPDYAHGTPAQSIEFIKQDLKLKEQELLDIDSQINQLIAEDKDIINMIYSKSKILTDSFKMRKYAAYVKNNFVLVGFIPTNKETYFANIIDSIKNDAVAFTKSRSSMLTKEEEAKATADNDTVLELTLSMKPADTETRLETPVKLRNNKFARPFEMFVNIYGLPGYKDIDPTPVMAITYTMLFGIMFGDVGQGLVFALLGWLLHKKNGSQLGQIITRIGFSSAFFGFFYGSTFGNETWLIPVHEALFGREHFIHVMAPSATNLILISAISIGIFLILMAMSFNIFLGFKQKDYTRAILSHNGIVGLVMYVSVLVAVACTMLLGVNLLVPAYILPLIVLPILIIFLKEPIHHVLHKKPAFPHGFGGFFAESFFELFEILLSFLSNTMSFLRVGGFVLSHAGMMLVVYTLSEMVGGTGSIFVIIGGNIFVMALEGMIVGIQVLRLEFYEIFSRFFESNGKPYKPVKIGHSHGM